MEWTIYQVIDLQAIGKRVHDEFAELRRPVSTSEVIGCKRSLVGIA